MNAMSAEPAASAPHRRGALVAVLLGFFAVMLDITIVNVALADMGTDLAAPVTSLQWVVDGYTLAFAAFLLSSGAACDRLGARTVYMVGLILFGAFSAVCALAPTGGALIAARALQGLGASAIVPGSLASLAAIYRDPGTRSRAIGLWGGAGGVAAAAGPVLGGALVSWIGWRAVFWVNIPIVILAYRLALRSLPVSVVRRERAIDPPGQALSASALAALTYGIIAGGESDWDGSSIAAALGGAIMLACFVAIENRADDPMLPMPLFGERRFTVAMIVGFALNTSFFGQLFVLSLFFQEYLGYTPWHAGLALAPQACSAVIASPLGGRCTARIGAFPTMLIGLLAGAAGFGCLIAVADGTPYPMTATATFIGGFGMAFAMPAATSAAVVSAPPAYAGLAGGVINAARQTGSAVGVAALGAMITADALLAGFHRAVGAASVVFLVAAVPVIGVLIADGRGRAAG